MYKFIIAFLFLVLCPACNGPTPLNQLPASKQPTATISTPTSVQQQQSEPTQTAVGNTQQLGHSNNATDTYNSISIQAGDRFVIHNPTFNASYAFRVESVTAEDIRITCDDPGVKIIRDSFDDGALLITFSLNGENMNAPDAKPIGWARFTPDGQAAVVQFYSMGKGGSIERIGDD